MVVMDLAVVQGLVAFMARAAVQILVFRDSRVEIISSNLVREDNISSGQVIRAIRKG